MTHEKFLEQPQREKKIRPGKPRDNCISCQAGIKTRDCDKKDVIYLSVCKLSSEEYVEECQRMIQMRLQEHYLDARKWCEETMRGNNAKLRPVANM